MLTSPAAVRISMQSCRHFSTSVGFSVSPALAIELSAMAAIRAE